jgi:methionyl-tRNA formyltransferase
MDAGPIIKQKTEEIDENETATTLLPHLFEIGTDCLLEAMPDVISGKVTMENALQQDEHGVVNADMIASAEGELCVWKESARECHNRTRGFSMWPGTFLYLKIGDGEPVKVKVIKSRVLKDQGEENTDVVELGPNKGDGLRVVCGDGSVLELLTVQPVTRKAMDAKSFVNGLRGETLAWTKTPEAN